MVATAPPSAPKTLDEWRARVTGATLAAILVTVTPLVLMTLHRDRDPGLRAFYLGGYLALLALTLWRRLDHRLRAGGLLLLGYCVAVVAMGKLGLAGGGRVMLLASPLQAQLLLGRSYGLLGAVVSVAVYVAFAVLAGSTAAPPPSSLVDVAAWTQQGLIMVMVGITISLLADRALTFQEQTLAQVRATSQRLAEELGERERRVARLAAEVARRTQLEREILEVGERERQGVGRELHDGICQQLTACHLAARILERDLAAHGGPQADQAAALAELLETTLADSRGLARGLNPQPLPAGTLGHALGDLARQVRETVEVNCDFVGVELPALPQRAATQLFRIAQEATANAVKHAGASRIVIDLAEEEGGVRLSVRDDGAGIVPGAPAGVGMSSMATRAEDLSGALAVRSSPDEGTEITCRVPVRPGRDPA
ncbi:MAG TPA: sensor histidine kinase [Polyangia bacterium]|jgi:signal transduction histidine kinase